MSNVSNKKLKCFVVTTRIEPREIQWNKDKDKDKKLRDPPPRQW